MYLLVDFAVNIWTNNFYKPSKPPIPDNWQPRLPNVNNARDWLDQRHTA